MTALKKEDTAPHVYKAIADVMEEMSKTGISKDNKNQQQGYKFRGIDDVYNALAPMLAKHKLLILPRTVKRTPTERTTKGGGVLFHVVLEMEFDFVSAVDGTKHIVSVTGEAMDSADKATNKAMSAAYKYACIEAFCIPTEGDNDADGTTHELAPNQPQQQQPAPATKEEVDMVINDISTANSPDAFEAARLKSRSLYPRMNDEQRTRVTNFVNDRKKDFPQSTTTQTQQTGAAA